MFRKNFKRFLYNVDSWILLFLFLFEVATFGKIDEGNSREIKQE